MTKRPNKTKSSLDNITDRESRLIREVRKSSLSDSEIRAIIKSINQPVNSTKRRHAYFYSPQKSFKFGLVGDTHLGSKYEDVNALQLFYDALRREGVTVCYHTGDLVDGEGIYRGQVYELHKHGFDEQVRWVAEAFPKVEGLETRFITGNHDESFYKQIGASIGKVVEEARPDMKWLGAAEADVVLGNKNCILRLSHPGGGTAYALSYRPQKKVESISGGEKPNVIAMGHYHKAEYFFLRNIHLYQTGTMQSQTPFMREKSLSAHKGGWILDIDVANSGTITRIRQEFVPFYE